MLGAIRLLAHVASITLLVLSPKDSLDGCSRFQAMLKERSGRRSINIRARHAPLAVFADECLPYSKAAWIGIATLIGTATTTAVKAERETPGRGSE